MRMVLRLKGLSCSNTILLRLCPDARLVISAGMYQTRSIPLTTS